jgi:hypothetical protein
VRRAILTVMSRVRPSERPKLIESSATTRTFGRAADIGGAPDAARSEGRLGLTLNPGQGGRKIPLHVDGLKRPRIGGRPIRS